MVKEKERERKKRKDKQKKEEEEKQKQNDVEHVSSINDPTHREDALPTCDPKTKQALDPNYYPLNYMPKQGVDASILLNNLVALPAKTKEEDQ